MRDKRFIRSEEVIIRAYLSIKGRMTVNNLLSRAQISRSTFYRHHNSMRRILLDYEDYLLMQFKKAKGEWRGKKEVRFYYRQLLFFIIANKNMVLFLVQHGEEGVIEGLVEELEPVIIEIIRLPKWAEMGVVVHRNELIGLLIEWGRRDGFSEVCLNKVLDNIVYLSLTAKERLLYLDN